MSPDCQAISDHWLAFRSELSLEAELYELDGNQSPSWLADTLASTLRRIDKLKASGEYEQTANILRLQSKTTPQKLKYDARKVQNLQDLLDVMKVDLDLAQMVEGWSIEEALPIARNIKPPRKRGGRPRLSPPWRDCVDALDEMRISVLSGLTIPEAARRAAADYSMAPNRWKHLDRMYRERARLREKNPA